LTAAQTRMDMQVSVEMTRATEPSRVDRLFHQVAWSVTELLTHDTVTAVAAEVGATPAQVLLRHSLQHGVVVIPKSSKPERIVETTNAVKVRLSAAQMARLDALNDARRGAAAAVEAHLKIIASPRYHWEAEISKVVLKEITTERFCGRGHVQS
jgi:hypothetical protein